ETLAFLDGVFVEHREPVAGRQEAPLQVDDGGAVRLHVRGLVDRAVPAGWRELVVAKHTVQERLQWIAHRPALVAVKSSAESSDSWDRRQSKSAYGSTVVPRGESLLLLQIAHEQAARPVIEADIVHGQHPHTEADLCADRVERRVERFLGDGEVG